MALVRRNGNSFPTLLSDLFDTDKFFGSSPFSGEFNTPQVPAVNVTETDKSYKIEVAAPGYKKDELHVDVEDDMLTISAEHKEESEEKNEKYTRREFSYGSFQRSFRLPESVESEDIKGKYEDGVLRLSIPKKETAVRKAKKSIKVD